MLCTFTCRTPIPTSRGCGATVFQGVQVYDVSLENGFVLKGGITQIPSNDDIWNDWNRQISRVLFIGPDLFTLSDAEVKVNDLTTLADKVSLELPALPDPPVVIIEPVDSLSTGGVSDTALGLPAVMDRR